MDVIANIADNYSQAQMIGLGAGFIALPIIAVALRLCAKLLGRRGLAWDDYLIVMALGFSIGCGSVQIAAAVDGQLGQHQTVGPDGMPLLNDPRFVIYEKCKFAVNILSTVGLGLTKASILIFYINIFFGPKFKLAAQVVLGIVGCWTTSFFFANLFTCYPVTPFIEPFYGNTCVDALSLWYSMAISDIIVDFIILFMPIPMVLGLQLPLKQKLGVLAMFLLGATVCAFSITRALIYVHVGDVIALHFNDETYYTSPVFFWATIELSSAIVSASLPTYRPIWLFLRGHPVNNTKDSVRLASYPREKGDSSRRRTYGYGSGGRSVPQSEFDHSDDIKLTPAAGVDTRVGVGRRKSIESLDPQITIERSFFRDSRPADQFC